MAADWGSDDDVEDAIGPDEASRLQLPSRARDYLIPAADSKGHSIRLYCRVMPAVARLVQHVHQLGRYPFRTQGDLIRWCVVDGTKRLAVGHGIESVWRRAETMLGQLAEEEYQLQFLEFFQKTQEIVDRYIIDGAPGEARRVVAHMKMQIEQMPEGEQYWRARYAQELLRRWRPLLDAAGSIGAWDGDADAADAADADADAAGADADDAARRAE